MKNKVIAGIVLASIVTTGLLSSVNADFGNFESEQKAEIRTLVEKVKSGETLTLDEQATLDKFKSSFKGNMGKFSNKSFNGKKGGMMMKGLTTEEKTALESMTTEEKKEFFEAKREERQAEMEAKRAEREAHEAVIDKLIDGEELTTEEKVILEEIKEKRAERKALREEREAQRAEIEPIMEKRMSGEDLTEEEQAKLEEFRENNGGKRGGHMGEGFHGMHR